MLQKQKDEIKEHLTYPEVDLLREQKQMKGVGKVTIDHQLIMWLKNLVSNLHLIRDFPCPKCGHSEKIGRNGTKLPILKKENKAVIVVGNGPSITDEKIKKLKEFKGTIICANKVMRRLLRNGIIPDWVTVLDGTLPVYESFDDDIVRKYADQIQVLCCTVVNPKVAQFMKNFKEVWWCNATISKDDTPNAIDMVNILTEGYAEETKTGGNAGSFGVLLASHMECNPVGMIGLDFSYIPDTSWDRTKARMNEYLFNPETGEICAVNTAFKAYLYFLHEFMGKTSKSEKRRYINLAETGMLRLAQREYLPDMAFDKFVDMYNKPRKFLNSDASICVPREFYCLSNQLIKLIIDTIRHPLITELTAQVADKEILTQFFMCLILNYKPKKPLNINFNIADMLNKRLVFRKFDHLFVNLTESQKKMLCVLVNKLLKNEFKGGDSIRCQVTA